MSYSDFTSYTSEELATIQAEYNESSRRYEIMADIALIRKAPDTIVIAGPGATVKVQNDTLAIIPGDTHKDMTAKVRNLYRGTHGIKHIVVLSNKGYITFDALRWLSEQDINIMVIGDNTQVLLSLPSQHDPHAALRRAQYLALETGYDLELARVIVRVKTEEQIKMLKILPSKHLTDKQARLHERKKARNKNFIPEDEAIWDEFEQGIEELRYCKDMTAIRLVEARLANSYWNYFIGLPIAWVVRDKNRVSPNWLYCSERISSLSSNANASTAVNPWQAVTNYAYAICEAQCKQALLCQGFDVSCGFLHADLMHRDSLVFDLIELHRSQIDALVYDMFSRLTLSKGDFMTSKAGECRMSPQFARYVASTTRLPHTAIDASAVWLKSLLLNG